MKTRFGLFKPLVQWLICVPLSVSGFGSLACGAEILISTQADFNAYREATLAPGDSVRFERGRVFTGMFAPRAVGTPGNVITITAFGLAASTAWMTDSTLRVLNRLVSAS